MINSVSNAFKKLNIYVQQANFKGWDLFDGLNSTRFKNSVFYRSEFFRLAWIQLFKKAPVNLRKIAGVPKGYNAKGLGLFASGLIQSGRTSQALTLLNELADMACSGFNGECWGYNFDWQARAFYVPVGKPNMVTSVFVANAFLDYYDVAHDRKFLKIGKRVCDFILNHLILYEDKNVLCFGYIPGEKARVHNANMLGAALLSRVYSCTSDSFLLDKSKKAMAYSIAALNPDYSWPYGERHHHGFIDNFHTGFNLVALKSWIKNTEDTGWITQFIGAYKYFLDTFWLENGCPKYYHDSLYPIDIHCSAQGIVTCLELAEYDDRSVDFAEKIAGWAIRNMMDPKGYFYYQKTKFYTNKIPYIRWSQAWMFYALSLLLKRTFENKK